MKFFIFTLLTTATLQANAAAQLVEGTATHFNFSRLADTIGAAEADMWMQASTLCLEKYGASAIAIRTSKVKTGYDRPTAVAKATALFKCAIPGQD